MSSWVDIQQKTFTRWCNEYLKLRGYRVEDMAKDFCDGVELIHLLEIISNKDVGRYNKNPRVPFQKLENVQIALEFLKNEGLKLVNIGPEDICDGRIKLILGMIWTIILRYQIQGIEDRGEGSAKKDLLAWINSKIPEYNVQNCTKDFNDGRALCALIDALQPGLCPGHRSMDPNNKLQNATLGIDTAYSQLGVPKLVLPEEMTHPRVDEHAMMTYLSLLRDLERKGLLKKKDDAALCKAYGDGLVEGIVDQQSDFCVETPKDCQGKLEVKVFGPKTSVQPIVTRRPNGIYDVKYTPTIPGSWEVHVTLDGKHIPGSVFFVRVLERESLGGEGKIRVFYTTTRASNEITRPLQELLEKKAVHKRPDFEPWVPVDIMDKDDRDAVFRVAGTRQLPIVYIDDQYVGDTKAIFELEKTGKLDKLLQVNRQHYDQIYGSSASKPVTTTTPSTASRAPAPPSKPVTTPPPSAASPAAALPSKPNFCPKCGERFSPEAKFCAGCGAQR